MVYDELCDFWESVKRAEIPGECQHVPPPTVFVEETRHFGDVSGIKEGIESINPYLDYLERRTRQRLLESNSRQADRMFFRGY